MLCQRSDTLSLVERKANWVDWDKWNKVQALSSKATKCFMKSDKHKLGGRRIKKVSGKQVVFF